MGNELILVLDGSDDLNLTLDQEGEFELTLGEGMSAAAYPGPYKVTPILNLDRTLFTQGLLMTDNVLVRQIPVTYTSNPYDGTTVVIG